MTAGELAGVDATVRLGVFEGVTAGVLAGVGAAVRLGVFEGVIAGVGATVRLGVFEGVTAGVGAAVRDAVGVLDAVVEADWVGVGIKATPPRVTTTTALPLTGSRLETVTVSSAAESVQVDPMVTRLA